MLSRLSSAVQNIQTDLSAFAFGSVRDYQKDEGNAFQPNNHGLIFRLADSLSRTWDLGLTAFGGPPVLFQIVHRRFVEGKGGKAPWVDEQTYQELFAVCQALPGPSSTKMVFLLILLHAGLVPAICGFFIWCLPGAIGMYLLSLGVASINETLPSPVYGLLSGLNASTVGIIALAATQLASNAITDPLTRILVVAGASAGLCYSALWYFPVIMMTGGFITAVWDIWISRITGKFRAKLQRQRLGSELESEGGQSPESVAVDGVMSSPSTTQRRVQAVAPTEQQRTTRQVTGPAEFAVRENPPSASGTGRQISAWQGTTIIAAFFITFTAVMVARTVISSPPLILSLFSNMYLAGTIIFGGGPVVIPLLREYVVEPGWVSPRDFLLGLAIIQAFPGPNFNFAVYLSALAVQSTPSPTILGALLGFLGIYTPGIVLALGIQGLWRVMRTKPLVISTLRGINATAVGLIFTAVYRLWEQGYLTPGSSDGKSLALQPWWVVVAALSYTGSAWFRVPPAVAIVMGGILGLLWYAAVGYRILMT